MVLSLERWSGKIAVVTGANSGCGASVVEAFLNAGINVVGLSRRKDRLDALSTKHSKAKGRFTGIPTDVTKEEEVIAAFKWIKANLGPVSILVNSAGLSQPTSLIGGDAAMWKAILETNILGLSIATREAIEHMLSANIEGHIFHINSVFGHRILPLPQVNMYGASKFAVTGLTETLRLELIAKKIDTIKITSISPGATATEFGANNAGDDNKDWQKLYEEIPKLSSEDVADAVVYALSTPAHVQVHELMLRHVKESL